MAAIVLQACTGTNAGTENTVIGVMMRANDSHLLTILNPIQIPVAGTAYSYEKWLRFKCTVAPSNQVTTFKYWGPNTIPAVGTLLFAGTNATGVTPVVTDSAVATTQQDTNYYDTSNQLAIGGTLVNINDESEFLVLQLDVATTASPGDIVQQTHNYSFDEN